MWFYAPVTFREAVAMLFNVMVHSIRHPEPRVRPKTKFTPAGVCPRCGLDLRGRS